MRAGCLLAFVTGDHKMLVELACSASLSVAYNQELFDRVIPHSKLGRKRTVIFIVCGGFKISRAEVNEYEQLVKQDTSQVWNVRIDGREVGVPKERKSLTVESQQ
jgi:L-serine/L-threonine ammonia-lyase